MDDGQMTAAMASSDSSHKKIEKREGMRGHYGLMMDAEGGVKVVQHIFVGEFRDGTLDGKCVTGLEPLMHIFANNVTLILLISNMSSPL